MSVDIILPAQEKLMIQVLANRQFSENGFNYLGEKNLQQVLADKYFISKCCINTEIDNRMRFLKHLLETGNSSRQEVRQAVAEYYQSKSK
jgi:hypothetical protein